MTELEDNNCSGVRGLICVTKGCRHVSPTRGSAKADASKLGMQMHPLKREQLLHEFSISDVSEV